MGKQLEVTKQYKKAAALARKLDRLRRYGAHRQKVCIRQLSIIGCPPEAILDWLRAIRYVRQKGA